MLRSAGEGEKWTRTYYVGLDLGQRQDYSAIAVAPPAEEADGRAARAARGSWLVARSPSAVGCGSNPPRGANAAYRAGRRFDQASKNATTRRSYSSRAASCPPMWVGASMRHISLG